MKQSDNTRVVVIKTEYDLELFKAKNFRKRRREVVGTCDNMEVVEDSNNKRYKTRGSKNITG